MRERPGKLTFRFWQEGPGHDRNINRPEAMIECIDYVHANPVRRGLCALPGEWRWSSWRQYHEPDASEDPRVPRITRRFV